MEVTLSLFAWLGVVILQALVHYLLSRTRTRGTAVEEVPALEASPLVLERRSKEAKMAGPSAAPAPSSRLLAGAERECIGRVKEKAGGAPSDDADANAKTAVRIIEPASSSDSMDTAASSVQQQQSAPEESEADGDLDDNDDDSREGDLDDDEGDSLDGDEPRVFFELLSQTGCEMMRVSRALLTWKFMNELVS